ncbi:hypothetical protein GF312_11875, partial [Candidatus Poribacteria bacterium]|nr:hypothetical protein [Candidatus Poribacteria bacterium]
FMVVNIWAATCGDMPNEPPKSAEKVAEDDPAVQNDYISEVKENTQAGITYLALVNGDQPSPNACGLNPSNDPAEWTGWGGPLEAENVTIGEGAGTRNEIVIGGVYFERGIGAHADGTFVYPLTGGNYGSFHGYVGMSDEKDPDECGHGGSGVFVFTIDGVEVFRSELLTGTLDGENVAPVEVEFDIPSGAQELVVQMLAGDDGNSCDHSCVADPKLIASGTTPVSPVDHLSTTWGNIKVVY